MKREVFSLTLALSIALVFTACGSSSSTNNCTTVSMGTTTQYVVNTLILPPDRTQYGYDLIGDGTLRNQLGSIISVLADNGVKPQDAVNTSIMKGDLVVLFDETSKDATFTTDDCAGSSLYLGDKVASMMPDFSGNGTFSKSTTGATGMGSFKGAIKAGAFNSNAPATSTVDVQVTLLLPLAGQAPVAFQLHGAHLKFTRVTDGTGKVTLMNGQLNGGVRSDYVQNNLIPSIADLLNAQIAAMPMSSGNMTILSLLDTGGTPDTTGTCSGVCKNSTGTCAVAGDKKIDYCEVATNGAIINLLRPDVQLFAADGVTYMPNKANTNRDSLSLGLAFTAVPAHF